MDLFRTVAAVGTFGLSELADWGDGGGSRTVVVNRPNYVFVDIEKTSLTCTCHCWGECLKNNGNVSSITSVV